MDGLLDLSKVQQVFGPDGKLASDNVSKKMAIRRTKQLGSGTQGEVFLSEVKIAHDK